MSASRSRRARCRSSRPARLSRRASRPLSDQERPERARPPVAAVPFPDRVAALVEERRSQIVLGLDPDPANLWPVAAEADLSEGERIAAHCRAAIEAAGPACVAVKPQLACFERLGSEGWRALEETVAVAHEHGLLVIADGKRGDVPVTAKVYGEALVGRLAADAFTANPLLGRDSLEPLLEAADAAGAGCFCLVRTSNPGAADVQDLDVAGAPLYEHLAGMVAELGAGRVGGCGLSSVGAVAGATRPELLRRLRELMPQAIFLLPGVGAQGGRAAELGPAFSCGRAAAIVTASRSLAGAADPAAAAAALREEVWDVACRAFATG